MGHHHRFFGLLHVRAIEGHHMDSSFRVFRRHRPKGILGRITCGGRPCGMDRADACFGLPDVYLTCHVSIGGGKHYQIGRTATKNNSNNPKWHYEFSTIIDVDVDQTVFPQDQFEKDSCPAQIIVKAWDDDMASTNLDDLLGHGSISLDNLIPNENTTIRLQVPIIHPKIGERKNKGDAFVIIELHFLPLVTFQPKSVLHVPYVYFKRAHGNLVRLYHDADCIDGQFPKVPLSNGTFFEAQRCWYDMYNAINEAKHLVFIAGWSVMHDICLLRSYVPGEKFETVGTLCKRKADEGVRVIIMIWDDVTSTGGVYEAGLMATGDEITKKYFQNSKVEVACVKRIAGDDVCQISGLIKTTSFTHHQKIVLYDTPNPVDSSLSSIPVLGAFIGGLDITAGRYDTKDHFLWGTLDNAHDGDFYNGCLPGATATYGPREPWHDVHARIIGPAAWDLMENFVERLDKQAPQLNCRDWVTTTLLDLEKIRDGRKVLVRPDDPSSWDVQIFRSGDSNSIAFNNRKWLRRYAFFSNVLVDRSIHEAYCYLIEQSQRFLYIENQYFLGSYQYWLDDTTTPCHHLVPFAIVRRICRAIDQSQDFTVYVIIPLFPEGAPNSGSVQEILFWQFRTIQMMYDRIGKKLQQKGVGSKRPKDFLQFFFIGQKDTEEVRATPAKTSLEIRQTIEKGIAQIYVHSKMMIVDDSYLLMGSANINERSMAGCRDTEIAFGASQPFFEVDSSDVSLIRLPKGDVYGFRLQLWMEHWGSALPEFEDPGSVRCSRKVQTLSDANWTAFIDDSIRRLASGYAITYPIKVESDGSVSEIPGHDKIPCSSGKVIGVKNEDVMTKPPPLP